MNTLCYVVTHHDYNSNDFTLVFYNKADATKEVHDEILSVLKLLEDGNYDWTKSETSDSHYEVWVKDTNINYEWDITESTIA